VVEMLLDESIADDHLRGTIFEKFSRQQLESFPAECRTLAIPTGHLYFQEVRQRYSYLRQFTPRLLEAFAIKAAAPGEPLLNAVEYLRDRNEEGQRGIDADAPLDFCRRPGRLMSVRMRERSIGSCGDLPARSSAPGPQRRQFTRAALARVSAARAISDRASGVGT
jgi:hypothetical protein